MKSWQSCAKQVVRCKIVTRSNQQFEGLNLCHHSGSCPRVAAGCETGERYDLCGPPVHAEEAAVTNALEAGADLRGAVAYLYGHDHYCRACQLLLTKHGVKTLVITGD